MKLTQGEWKEIVDEAYGPGQGWLRLSFYDVHASVVAENLLLLPDSGGTLTRSVIANISYVSKVFSAAKKKHPNITNVISLSRSIFTLNEHAELVNVETIN